MHIFVYIHIYLYTYTHHWDELNTTSSLVSRKSDIKIIYIGVTPPIPDGSALFMANELVLVYKKADPAICQLFLRKIRSGLFIQM